MKEIKLFNNDRAIQQNGQFIFDRLTNLPLDVRPEVKERTGVNIMFRIQGLRENFHTPIALPSSAAHDFTVEKSVRTELMDDATSQDSENEEIFRYRGCITYELDGRLIHCSVSGLFGTEDVAIAIVSMATKVEVTIDDVIANIQRRGGKLPEEIFQEGHYLKNLLDIYR